MNIFNSPANNKWFSVKYCVKCEAQLGTYDTHFNDGVCPHCGNKGWSGIITETKTKVVKFERTSPWWRIWNIEGNWEEKWIKTKD